MKNTFIFKTTSSIFIILFTSFTSLAQCVPYAELNQTPLLQFAHFGAVDIADIDNDGDQDLLISGSETIGSLIKNTILYQNDGFGNFSILDDSTFSTDVSSMKFGDVDNDNDQDIFISGLNPSSNKLYLNNGFGVFSLDITASFPPIYHGDFDFGDLDGDGDLDILIAGKNLNLNFGTPVSIILENNGAGIFTELQGNAFTGVEYSKVLIFDIDNDNDQDAIIAGTEISGTKTVNLYINDSQGNYTMSTNSPFDSLGVNSISNADLESDGDTDLLINYHDGSTRLYINDSIGNFTEVSPSSFEPVIAGECIFADIDNDGAKDVICSGAGGNNANGVITFVYKNNGDATFSLLDSLVGAYGSSMGTADFNNDNFIDLVIMGNTNDFDPSNMHTLSRTRIYLNTTLDLTITQVDNLLSANNNGAGITYQWIDCADGSEITGSTAQTFSATTNGNYAVIINDNGCIDTSACVSISSLGIIENGFGKDLLLYPNPTDENVSIELGSYCDNVTLIVRNVYGNEMVSQNLQNTDLVNVKIEGAPGIYFLTISCHDKNATFKILKK
ncbi:MAG: hypothetical protein ACI8V8_002407 [Chitinophagales bacterium]|jgi:hypothetical protein